MNPTVWLIGLGGFLGTLCRYGTSVWVSRRFPAAFIPYGTLLVNVLGCLLIGIIFGLSEKHELISAQWRLILVVGFCGGFTTFSSFAYENVAMLQQGNYTGFIVYTLSSVLICLLSVVGGLYLVK
jgi:CrcB protein